MTVGSRIYDVICVSSAVKNVLNKNIELQKKYLLNIYETSSLRSRARDGRVGRFGNGPISSNVGSTSKPFSRSFSTLKNVRYYSTDSSSSSSSPSSPSSTSSSPSPSSSSKVGTSEQKNFIMDSSPVPSSRISRLFHYGSLATGLGIGALTETIRRIGDDKPSTSSVLFNPSNLERLVKKLSQMRGAALKVGQLLSFQDQSLFPAEIQSVMSRVQNSANYMPRGQLERVISRDLGKNWRTDLFSKFDDYPIAAASIGQVHKAVLLDGYQQAAVKVQYPGVANSIDSDLNNLMLLLTASRFLPEGLFLDKTIDNARVELKWETDYLREAQNIETFREFLKDDEVFTVPKVYHNASSEHVLTMEYMRGKEITKYDWDQKTKDWIATNIMRLCLLEIAKFKFMQTDPNWANFLYNEQTNKIELLDFGAARGYGDEFIENYLGVLRAAIKKDRKGCEEYSVKLGYLTGLESQSMLDTHIDSILVLGEPFSTPGEFDFTDQTITTRVRSNIGVMLRERLTPPPEETYGLHRKLSGAFLLCAKLNAKVPCSKLFDEIVG